MIGVHRLLVELLLLLALAHVVLLAPVHFRQQLDGPALRGVLLEHIPQGLPRVAEGVVLHVLPRQPQPLLHLPPAAAALDLPFQRKPTFRLFSV